MTAPKKQYPDVEANPDFPKVEEQVLSFWKQQGTFKRSVEERPATKGGKNNEFIFYDGPPFANGLPHYGHLLTGFVKDVIARYQTMQGKRVERRFGWDCHGLPAEMGAEKELGISGRAQITNYGIGMFNEYCRTSVMKYTHEWEDYVTRQARWVDFSHDYKTMDRSFMESVLWAFSELYKKGLVYEAYRVMPYSWAAETPLSNFETKLDNSYRDREDKAITVAFELNTIPSVSTKIGKILTHHIEQDRYKAYIIAWTTTPWTLPSNLALAVNGEMQYSFSLDPKTKTINIASTTYHAPSAKEAGLETDEMVCFNGTDLVGLTYKPLFPYFKDHPNSFRIIDGSDFVTDADGTGIVHIAPGFGEDDQRVSDKNGIEILCPVDHSGKFTDEIFDLPDLKLRGLNVIAETKKDADEPYDDKQLQKFGLANLRIIKWLKTHEQLIKEEVIKHSYPHCWRTDTPLIYRAMPSWYVEVTKFRDRAVEINKQINWVPEHVRDGQMGHMLATAPDWSISRNRFWGTPIPVWRSNNPNSKEPIKVFGSIKELEEFFGREIDDLHRPHIDELVKEDGAGFEYRRVTDVFDCWFESGSMPFAQVHYPFSNKEWFDNHFPADFITEYVGQTRGWFNTLIMLSTALFDKPPFLNCICHGVVLDAETGLKYSKRLKNYKDPLEVINQFGADALRWLMIASPVMRGQDLSVDPEGKFIRDVVRLAIKPVWNAYNFFCLYANADGMKAKFSTDSQDVMDRYILAKCKQAVEKIESLFNEYDTPSACEAVTQFFEALNNWYIRRNKERFWKEQQDADKQAAYDTLYTVLTTMCRAAAPLLPLTCEEIYKTLTGEESVHLAEFPDVSAFVDNNEIVLQMDWVRDVCNTALAIRNKTNIRVRQPLRELKIIWEEQTRIKFAQLTKSEFHLFLDIVKDEVNVKEFSLSDQSNNPLRALADLKLNIHSAVLGKRVPENMKQIIPASKKGEWKFTTKDEVQICNIDLLPSEYTLQLEPKPEYKDRAQALSTNDALVILDTTVTPELEREGVARDIVRMIQQARKDAGLNVADRIQLSLAVDKDIEPAVKEHKAYISEQTLAVSLDMMATVDTKHRFENTLNDKKIVIGFSVAA